MQGSGQDARLLRCGGLVSLVATQVAALSLATRTALVPCIPARKSAAQQLALQSPPVPVFCDPGQLPRRPESQILLQIPSESDSLLVLAKLPNLAPPLLAKVDDSGGFFHVMRSSPDLSHMQAPLPVCPTRTCVPVVQKRSSKMVTAKHKRTEHSKKPTHSLV